MAAMTAAQGPEQAFYSNNNPMQFGSVQRERVLNWLEGVYPLYQPRPNGRYDFRPRR